METITGSEKCERCGKINEWEIHPGQNGESRNLYAYILNENKVHPSKCAKTGENEYLFQYRCKYCDKLNRFTIYSEMYL